MEDQDLALAEKAYELFAIMQFCTEQMKEANTDEQRMKWLVRSMHLVSKIRYVMAEALTDDEIKLINKKLDDRGEWDMWKKANTAEGTKALLKHYADLEKEGE